MRQILLAFEFHLGSDWNSKIALDQCANTINLHFVVLVFQYTDRREEFELTDEGDKLLFAQEPAP